MDLYRKDAPDQMDIRTMLGSNGQYSSFEQWLRDVFKHVSDQIVDIPSQQFLDKNN